jgi:hypothetical protein
MLFQVRPPSRICRYRRPNRALAIRRFARADPHDVRIALKEAECADRVHGLFVEDRRDGDRVVGRFPDAARCAGDVDRRGSDSSTATSVMRPDIVAGPMNRNRSVLSIAASTNCACAGTTAPDRANVAERYTKRSIHGRVIEGRRKRRRAEVPPLRTP